MILLLIHFPSQSLSILAMLDQPVSTSKLPDAVVLYPFMVHLPPPEVVVESASHVVCRKAILQLTKLNKKKCSAPYVPEEVSKAVYSEFATKCEDQTFCHARFWCHANSRFRGCSRAYLQHGLDRAGWHYLKCRRHLKLVFNALESKPKANAVCLTDAEVEAREANWKANSEAHRTGVAKKEIYRLLGAISPEEEQVSSREVNWSVQKKIISNVIYDVGTSYSCLDFASSDLH